MGAGPLSLESGAEEDAESMIADAIILRLSGVPICRCSICASNRGVRLAQALQDKFQSAAAAWKPHLNIE